MGLGDVKQVDDTVVFARNDVECMEKVGSHMKRPICPKRPLTFDPVGWREYEAARDKYYEDELKYAKHERRMRYASDGKKWQNKTLYAAPHGVMWVELDKAGARTVKYGVIKCNGYSVGHDTFAWYKGGVKFWNDPHIAHHGHQRGAFTEEVFELLKKVYNDDVDDLTIVQFVPEPYKDD